MIVITTETRVEAYFWKRRGRESHGYVEDQGKRNVLVKRWKLLGRTVWTRIIDSEDVPSNVWISAGALGFYDGPWKSKFHAHVTLQN